MKHSIITIHHIHNSGSVFQAYSLYRYLELNGYDTEIIDYQPGYYKDGRNQLVLMTPTIGVGTNRDLGLELCEAEYGFIVDDDMVFYDNVEETLNNALEEHPDADVIIFNFDYMRDGEKIRDRMKNSQKINFFNCLNFGICCALVKISSIKQKKYTFYYIFWWRL